MLIFNLLNKYSDLRDFDGDKKKLKSKDAVARIISVLGGFIVKLVILMYGQCG